MAPYRLPEFARHELGKQNGVPWEISERVEDLNRLIGLVANSFQAFRSKENRAKFQAVMYETWKQDICSDGGIRRAGDTWLPDTAHHDVNGKPINADNFPYAVMPLRHPGGVDLQDFGLRLGDIGLIYTDPPKGAPVGVKYLYTPVIYGDLGPKTKIGEVSVYAAKLLGVNPDPVRGGEHDRKNKSYVHVAFPGSADPDGTKQDTNGMIRLVTRASELLAEFTDKRAW